MAARTTRTRAKAKPAPAPVEDIEEELEETEEDVDADFEPETDEDDEELEELEEDEAVDEKPAPKKKKAADTVTFGIRDLVSLIKKETGEDTDPRALRTLIRKMARDESGRVNREITAGNRTRYDWTGPNDPEVRAIVKAFKDGELEADKQEKLAALKERKASQTAAKKKAAASVEVEEDEEEEEAPAPARRRVAKKAPAKPAARRRVAKPAPVEEVEDDEELDLDDE